MQGLVYRLRRIYLPRTPVNKPCLQDGLHVRADQAHTYRYKLGAARAKGARIMTEATGGGGGGRAEMERRLIQRSLQDEDFRQQLLADPRAIIERELGTRLPEGVRVVAVEETADTIYLVLPSASPVGDEGGELTDSDLESVSGAGWGNTGNPWDPRRC